MSKSPKRLIIFMLFFGGCSSGPGPRIKPRLSLSTTQRVAVVLPLVERASAKHEVPTELILGVIHVESRFRPQSRSSVGARGLMQLMPRTAASLARRLGYEDGQYDIDDPAFNIDAGTSFLAYLIKRFEGDVHLALAAYNSGPARVSRWKRQGRSLPGYSRRYVASVIAARDRFSSTSADEPHHSGLDREALRSLIRGRRQLYGERPDEPLESAEEPAEETTD